MKVPIKDRPTDHVTFRALLLNRCQMEFERSKAADQQMEKFAKAIAEAKTVNIAIVSCEFACMHVAFNVWYDRRVWKVVLCPVKL